MNSAELLRKVVEGRLLLVGEYRGSYAENAGYVDRKHGKAIKYIRAIHLLERRCGGQVERAVIYERLPDTVETPPEEIIFPHQVGRMYAFYVDSIQSERGQVTGRMGVFPPVLLDESVVEDAGLGLGL